MKLLIVSVKQFGWLLCLLVMTDPVAAQTRQQAYHPPKLENDQSWSLVFLPDPQSYVKFERNQPVFDLMTAWISENIDPLRIGMVLCAGDLVEQNALLVPDGIKVNQPSKKQWESVARSFGRLDGKVPYVSATGNHDYGVRNIEYRKTAYNDYFPVDKNFLSQKLLREAGTDAEGMPTLTNAAYGFVSPHGKKFLVLVLEFAPRDTVLNWGLKVVNQEAYRDHTVILLTHSYLNAEGKHIVKEGYPITDGNYGAAIWEKLVKPSRNIELVLCGHIGKPDDPKGHIGFRTDKNSAGKTVHQMLFNAQALGGGWHGNGGDGWLRILEFLPDGKTVRVKTFSPLFAISPSTRHLAWRTDHDDSFTFVLD